MKTIEKLNNKIDSFPYNTRLLIIFGFCIALLPLTLYIDFNLYNSFPLFSFSWGFIVAFTRTCHIISKTLKTHKLDLLEGESTEPEEDKEWWDVIGVILDNDPHSYEDSIEIIKELKEKYTLTIKEQ